MSENQDADTETTDQLTFQNPATRYPSIEPPVQHQDEPGLDARLEPKADLGEHSYRGTGRLTGRRALITGGDSGIGVAARTVETTPVVARSVRNLSLIHI